MKSDMNFHQIITWLDKVGWEKGYSQLKEIQQKPRETACISCEWGL